MENKNKLNSKLYLISGLTQIVIILIFILSTYFMFKLEKIILNPIPYILCISIPLIIIDSLSLIFIFNKYYIELVEEENQ